MRCRVAVGGHVAQTSVRTSCQSLRRTNVEPVALRYNSTPTRAVHGRGAQQRRELEPAVRTGVEERRMIHGESREVYRRQRCDPRRARRVSGDCRARARPCVRSRQRNRPGGVIGVRHQHEVRLVLARQPVRIPLAQIADTGTASRRRRSAPGTARHRSGTAVAMRENATARLERLRSLAAVRDAQAVAASRRPARLQSARRARTG